jgi:sterol O-acyltransferase
MRPFQVGEGLTSKQRGHVETPEKQTEKETSPVKGQTRSPIRKTVFQHRTSPLDYETLQRERNTMRGFFVLFWMIMFVYFLLTMLHNYRLEGSLIGWKLANVFTKDHLTLALSDLVMALSTYYCVFFMKLVLTRWISLSFATVLKVSIHYPLKSREL